MEFFQWYALLKTGPSVPEGLQPAGLERDFKASFARRVVRRWRENVKTFARDVLRSDTDTKGTGTDLFKPFGCTLLAAMVTKDRAFLFQLGDGGIFLRKHDGEIIALAEDDDEPGEATDSLASGDPEKVAITSIISLDEVSALMLATDGLTKSFTKADAESIPRGIGQTMSWLVDRVANEKLDVEGPVFNSFLDSCSEGGTGDDVTVAIAFSREKLIGNSPRPPGNNEQGRAETIPPAPESSEPADGSKPQELATKDSSERSGSEDRPICKSEGASKPSISDSPVEIKPTDKELKSGGASTQAGDVF